MPREYYRFRELARNQILHGDFMLSDCEHFSRYSFLAPSPLIRRANASADTAGARRLARHTPLNLHTESAPTLAMPRGTLRGNAWQHEWLRLPFVTVVVQFGFFPHGKPEVRAVERKHGVNRWVSPPRPSPACPISKSRL
jgi:hypothetical protein